jgi:hypothetical protein
MKRFNRLALVVTVICLNGSVAFSKDEPWLRADHKIRGYEVQTYQQHAQDQAQTLYYYSTTKQPIAKAEAKELATGIRKSLTASDKALAFLKAEHAKEPDIVKQIEAIEKHHAKAHELCGMVEGECAKEHSDHVVIGDCCSEMWHELDAAKTKTQKLLKTLKLDKLEPPKKVEAKKEAPKK